jgi:hypothetical protein
MPWLGYFDKMDRADTFVLLDDVQFKKNEWQNRNRVRNANGSQWITVPVSFDFGDTIDQVRIDNHGRWEKKHLKSLETNYAKAPFFQEYFPFFRETYSRRWDRLSDLNVHIIDFFKSSLGIEAELRLSSDMGIRSSGTRRLVDICERLGADAYLAGEGGREYMDIRVFGDKGIDLEFQRYEHPEYEQVYDGFEPFMSVVDLLFNHGKRSLDIIRSGRTHDA